MLYKSLPTNMKVKIRLAEACERRAEDAVPHDAHMFMEKAAALYAEVEAFTMAEFDARMARPTVSDLIREGAVCGTCADEGARHCNCYDLLDR